MKKLLIVTVLLISFTTFSQTGTYEITNTSNTEDVKVYQNAMDKADFSMYHYQSERRTIKFESGVEIQLLSIDELNEKGIETSHYQVANYDPNYEEPVYKLTDTGHILKVHNNPIRKR